MARAMKGTFASLKYLRRYFSVFALTLALAAVGEAAARDLWVAPEGVACTSTSTACSCTEAAPCVLTRELFVQLVPGDSVNLLSGSYPGLVVHGVHGSPDQPIVIRGSSVAPSADSKGATIRGDNTGRRDALELVRSSHLVIENLRVSHARRAGIRVNNSHHVEIRNSLLDNNAVWGIFTNHANHFSATRNTIVGPARQHGIYHSNSADHVQIIGNYIVGFERAGVQLNGDLSMGGASGVTPDGVISHVEIRDNFLAGHGSGGGGAINLDGVETVFIEGNILVGNKAAGITVFREDGAIGSRHVYAQRNLLVMAPESRWAIIFNKSGPGSHFSNNVIIAQDKRRGVYDVNNVSHGVLPYSEIEGLPFTSDRNYFYYAGSFAVLNNRERLGFRSWQRRGQDDASALLELGVLLEPGPDFALQLPESVSDAMNELGVALQNPYRHLLDVESE
ncbi:right-handed parallel beta-helix repeat-containing protein [Haliea sp. E1-2-M8]|uniref:right-handed parallel beta-helix repeat-containing protein n=1 Tax=Haliea sp. E1-2-M8 TaxID=3064706 RepID=UPI002716275D|nr:right-handed parallel beta-helix repeat-containing protein [Haliea sp. E1-2-M8]MDO8860430.1 right-handed parallel beta-helix repeat-containing protein [Haliea sp. E1-2-M8]